MLKILMSFVFVMTSANALAHGISEESKRAMIEGGFLKYAWLGAEHMLTGYDHLLFLFGVIFFLTKFSDIVKFITIFTLGHSLTLIGATFLGISANYFLVDAVIALSVCYKGFDNNQGFQKYFEMKKAPNLLIMVFIFGLIHGFGLSTRLQQLPLGEKGWPMLGRIISFNIGVEAGQILALSLMLILLSGIRKTDLFKRISRVSNDALILAGFLLFLMQMHGFFHQEYPDEFGFSKDEHIHHHLDMDAAKEKEINNHDNL